MFLPLHRFTDSPSVVQYAHLTCELKIHFCRPTLTERVSVRLSARVSNGPRSTGQAEMEPWCHLFWCHKSMGSSLPGASLVLAAWRQITSQSHRSPAAWCFSLTALSNSYRLRIRLKISHCINLYQFQCICRCINIWWDLVRCTFGVFAWSLDFFKTKSKPSLVKTGSCWLVVAILKIKVFKVSV